MTVYSVIAVALPADCAVTIFRFFDFELWFRVLMCANAIISSAQLYFVCFNSVSGQDRAMSSEEQKAAGFDSALPAPESKQTPGASNRASASVLHAPIAPMFSLTRDIVEIVRFHLGEDDTHLLDALAKK